jgi:hypothetical protein
VCGRGASQSASGLALGTLCPLRILVTLRLSKGLAWLGDLLFPAWRLGFGLVTRWGLSGRWHFDLLHVSNEHDTKHRLVLAGIKTTLFRDGDIVAHRRDYLTEHACGSGFCAGRCSGAIIDFRRCDFATLGRVGDAG